MNRISKEIAARTATALLAEKEAAIKKHEDELKAFTTTCYERMIPKTILAAFGLNPNYFHQTNAINVSGTGLNYTRLRMEKYLPYTQNTIQFNDDDCAIVVSLQDKISDLQKNYTTLKREVEIALFNLRTYKNVQDNFPEAFKLLPANAHTTAIAININDIRARI